MVIKTSSQKQYINTCHFYSHFELVTCWEDPIPYIWDKVGEWLGLMKQQKCIFCSAAEESAASFSWALHWWHSSSPKWIHWLGFCLGCFSVNTEIAVMPGMPPGLPSSFYHEDFQLYPMNLSNNISNLRTNGCFLPLHLPMRIWKKQFITLSTAFTIRQHREFL